MIRYHEGKRVRLVRNYMLGGESYSVVSDDGVERSVKSKDLSDSLKESTKKGVFTQRVGDSVVHIDKEGMTFTVGSGERLPNDVSVSIIAVDNKNKEFNLGDIDELDDSSQVKKLKLSPVAIRHCLDGKQKQHKGYRFRKLTKVTGRKPK